MICSFANSSIEFYYIIIIFINDYKPSSRVVKYACLRIESLCTKRPVYKIIRTKIRDRTTLLVNRKEIEYRRAK